MPANKSKKGPTKGSGGKGRRALEGKKGTLPAEQRHWYADKQRARDVERTERRGAAPSGGAARGGGRRDGGQELLIGRNPVVEALRAGVPATRLFLVNSLDKDDRITEAAKLAGAAGIEIHEVTRPELDRRCDSNGQPDAVHQGIALQVPPYRYRDAEDLLDAAAETGRPALIVALDGVTDPHNLGAVARSAAAFGAHGLLIPERRSAGVTMSAWKTSAGTLARLPVAQATNLTRTLEAYKKAGVFVVGLDAGGDTPLDGLPFATDPLVIVVGSEGRGLSRLVRATCDAVASIPISGAESLNASVAAGVALYEVARRRSSGQGR
ncbi:23S rRNA (guanosine(2251)-2'-O)-methyltransferase RlmB [Marinitenerispora sediminis]|uniref:23S rRNA (Guanosine(2251)-2'-O)-methyltransferase RlmB n=1 Tax=Marinitenerispora sediminis TaxID=1931232 RepID=A0A368T3N3_9ACTN|nr:23S rRNA (guanosine(2251)-2'-O)-methyltransferase RlmB [Marinitenerispora sediminis]RCV54861.1 23S rRNA (guanosine(2251)-2'-O)-methyltransferase RlmB [Marinitenerispora sediminis]RCV57399.1 23S rRNA (guanosine(2251)-2'-O)-methyltransferase RlmB [Marinitenerispora sediminis]RCV60262.1 23S rRNA (guanosine(2251)-2'-O)-methyltransferase RlmB [Marinitenerispora sediminis]